MDNIADTLQADFDAFIDQPVPMAFFSGLSDYVGYVLEMPQLKAIVDEVMKGKIEMYDELDQLENKALEEIKTAKEKLLKIIKDNNVDPATLTINLSSAPGVSHDHNLLEQLALFEDDKVLISGFRSRTLEMYLFDIAAALAKMGYTDQLKEFIVPGEEYGRIYADSDGEDHLLITGNIYGNFVFSKTAELLIKKDAQIDRVSGFGMWTTFDPLLKLHEAYIGRSKGMVKHAFLNDYVQRHTPRNAAEAGDLSDVSLAFDDLRGIADGTAFVGPIVANTYKHYLGVSEFKGYATRAHRHLLKELARASTQQATVIGKTTPTDEAVVENPILRSKPRLLVEKDKNGLDTGHLQLSPRSPKLRIAESDSRKFNLVVCLFSPEASVSASYAPTLQSYDRVFGKIGRPEDKMNDRLNNDLTRKEEMLAIIKGTIKEIRRSDDMKKHLDFVWRGERVQLNIKP
jgi:hypothetical protein